MGLQSVLNSYSLPFLSLRAFPAPVWRLPMGFIFLPAISTWCDVGYFTACRVDNLNTISTRFLHPGAAEASLPGTSLLSVSPSDCRVVSHMVPLRPGCLAAFSLSLLIHALWWDLAGANCVCLHTGNTPAPLPFSLEKPCNLNQIQLFKDARI